MNMKLYYITLLLLKTNMNMKTYCITLLLLFSVILFQCHPIGEGPTEGGVLNVDCENCPMAAEGGTLKIHVATTNADGWDFEVDGGKWAKGTRVAKDSLFITYQGNSSIESREAFLRISAAYGTGEGGVGEVFVQAGLPRLTISPGKEITLAAPEDDTTLTITARVGKGWHTEVSSQSDWLSLKRLGEGRLRIGYTENTANSPRSATIIVYVPAESPYEKNLVEQTISITQTSP